jgi:diadenosine tetraphosphate (Ap4A) HIT family hydrolase
MFELDPTLGADTLPVTALELSVALLMNDRAVPWLILVPQRPGLRELHDLPAAERGLLMEEIALASRVLERRYRPDKLNVGALGNRIAQLHIHVVARFRADRAWPAPIWGSGPVEPYPPGAAAEAVAGLREALRAEREQLLPPSTLSSGRRARSAVRTEGGA